MSGPSKNDTRHRWQLWIALAALALVIALVPSLRTLGRWAVAAAILTFGGMLVEVLDAKRVLARLTPFLPALLLLALGAVLLGELALGRPPASRDHGIHYFQTHILVHDMIPSGRLIGWSDRLNNGYPFGDSYPILGYLWMGALSLLTFGLVPLRASYALGTLLLWALAAWGVWQLAAGAARELGRGGEGQEEASATTTARWAGCIGAGLWLLDPGGSRQGGWNYLMFHGVWPQLLSVALWVVSLPLTLRALQSPSPRRLAAAGLVLGASVMAHPFGMLTGAVSMVLWPVALVVSGARERLPSGCYRFLVALHLLAAAVSAGFVVVFLSSAGSMSRTPVAWASLGDLATQLVQGELFAGHRAWVGPLSLVGIIVTLRRGKALTWLLLALVAAILVLGSTAVITVLRLDLVVAGFKNLQFSRWAIALKPLMCAFAGAGAVVLIAGLRSLAPTPWKGIAWPRRLLVAVLLSPFLVALVEDAGRLVARPVGGVETLERSGRDEVERELRNALEREQERLDETQRLRVAFLRQGMGGGTYPILAVADVGGSLVLDSHVPAVTFRHRVRRRGPAVLQRLGVTHVIFDRDLKKADRSLSKVLDPVGVFGTYRLARLRPPKHRQGAIEISSKDASFEVVQQDEAALVLDVAGVEAGRSPVKVTLVQAPYRKWHADLDGEPLATEEVALHGGSIEGTTIHVPRSGRLSLRYVHEPREVWSGWLSVVAIAAGLLALLFGNGLQVAHRLHSPLAMKISWGLFGLSLLVGLALVHRRQQRQLDKTWAALAETGTRADLLDAPRTFLRDLAISGEARLIRVPGIACDGLLGRDALEGCSEADARLETSMLYVAPYLYRCLELVVPRRGAAALELEGIESGAGVLGMLEHTGPRRGNKRLRYQVVTASTPAQAKTAVVGSRRHDFWVAPEQVSGSVTVRFVNEDGRPHRVCVAAAELR